jgi:hypothetical protein
MGRDGDGAGMIVDGAPPSYLWHDSISVLGTAVRGWVFQEIWPKSRIMVWVGVYNTWLEQGI